MSILIDLAQQLENSAVGVAIAEGRYAFPVLEGVHLIALSVAVGMILLTDLRLLGVFLPDVPASTVHRELQPWVLGGFGVVILAGVLLFTSEATAVIVSPPWPFKLAFMALAGCNALYFELVLSRRENMLPDRGPLPVPVRCAGGASMILWLLVIVCGRLIPYLPQWS